MNDNSTRRFYDAHAESYFEATHSTSLEPFWALLSDRLLPGSTILDLGCGSGRDLRHFAKLGFCVCGVDYSFNLLKLAKEYSQQAVIQGDFSALPFANHSFDAVWAMASLLHTPKSAIQPLLYHIGDLLKANGFLFTAVKSGVGEGYDHTGRYNAFYGTQEWGSLLLNCGFDVLHVEQCVELRQFGPCGLRIDQQGIEEQEVHWIVSLSMVSCQS